ncbi:hypothetical protein Tco_1007722 [Tanacetum coccineum]
MLWINVCRKMKSKTLYPGRSFRSLMQKQYQQRTNTRAEGTTEGKKQNRNKSKSWKIGERKDKEVNQAARDPDDALVCCVENTVEDLIMDSDDKTVDIAGIGDLDEEGYHVSFGDQQWKVTKGSLVVAHGNKCGSLYGLAWWFGEAEESFLHNVSEDKETIETVAGVAVEIMEYMVKVNKKARILELKRRYLKITVLTINMPYPSRKIWRICACTSLQTTKETRSNTPYLGKTNTSYSSHMEIKYSGRYQTWSLLQEIPNTP